MIGSDRFWFGKYTYCPPGSAISYVVAFKVDYGVSSTNEKVQEAKRLAEADAPVYFSLCDSRDYA